MTLLETAFFWIKNGYSVIPLGYRSKRPAIKTWEPYQTMLPTQEELLQWFPSELRNIGLITGNGLVVIDFDVMDVFEYWYKLFPVDTYMVKTRRGVHVYVTTWTPAKNFHSDLLDVKAERGYILIPPSIHPSGFQYQIYKDAPIKNIEKLADILPGEFTPEPELTPAETISQNRPVETDPWNLADNAIDIDQDLIKKIRERLSILSIIPNAEKSSTDGRWYVTLCPFHADHTPSFWIDTQRQMCGCRKCNIKEMDVINLYARIHNINNQDAILELAKKI